MSDTLLIHYNPKFADQATWSMVNAAGELTYRITTGNLSELAESVQNQEVVMLLHSQCLHLNQVQLPAMNMQKTMKAVPFAIEEFIAQDIEDFHLVASRSKHSNLTSVIGIEREVLQTIIDLFSGHGISIDKILPDVLCLPVEKQQWACLKYHDDCYLQTDALAGAYTTQNLFGYVLNQLLARHSTQDPEVQTTTANTPDRVLFFNEQQATEEFPAQDNLPQEASFEAVQVRYNQHPLVIFCGHYKQAMPLNLLQNEFKPRSKSSGYWSQWKLAASLAAIWLVLSLSVAGYQYSRLQQQNQELEQQIIATYKKAFPESKRIVNPLSQMKQKLKEMQSGASGGSNGLLFLLSEAFGNNQINNSNVTLQTLSFRNNKIDISLESTNLQSIENLNNMLNKSDSIHSEITSSTAEKDKVRGNIRIEAKG